MAQRDERAERRRLKDQYLREQQQASAARVPLDRAQLEELLVHVEAAVGSDGCDHTLAAAEGWATRTGVDVDRLREGLEECGGFCDCEVVMNVYADSVFTPVRTPRG